MTPRAARRERYCAIYIDLPFALADHHWLRETIVVPALADSTDHGQPVVRLRFHKASPLQPTLKQGAWSTASSRSSSRLSASWRLRRLGRSLADRPQVEASVVVAEMVVERPTSPVTSEVSTELFEYCLRALNRFLDVYIVATEDSRVHPIRSQQVGPGTVLGLRPRPGAKNRILLAPRLEFDPDALRQGGRVDLLDLLPQMLQSERHRHPLDLVRTLKVRADRLADDGFNEAAVVMLQASVERMVHAVHFLARVERGADRSGAEEMIGRPFKSALLALANEVGGNWSIAGNGVVATYWTDLYALRGSLVHGGRPASDEEVFAAFAAYEGIWEHVRQRALVSASTSPRLALAIHGGVGLREAGMLTARMRAVIRQIEDAGEARCFWLPLDERRDVGR